MRRCQRPACRRAVRHVCNVHADTCKACPDETGLVSAARFREWGEDARVLQQERTNGGGRLRVPRTRCRSREAETKQIQRQNTEGLKHWRTPRESLHTTAIFAIIRVPRGGIGLDSRSHAM
jgi:hypothetical protein